MSLAHNTTSGLWKRFMTMRKEIKQPVSSDLFSIQVYNSDYFKHFSPHTVFDKWAAIEVINFDNVADAMETFTLPQGLYGVFNYKGSSAEGAKVFEYIFGTWLPGSDYVLDELPHFEIPGEKYKNNDPESEEEIWIPVRSIEVSENH